MAKHGPEQHLIRADGVYITSMLQPTVGAGFNPVPDTMAIAARFVAPTGLAGTVGTAHRMRRVSLLGAPRTAFGAALQQRWLAFKARVQANIQANRLLHDMRFKPAGGVVTVDTSPRGPAPSPTALAVQSGWAPAPQSPASAAGYAPAQGDPPNQGGVTTALNLAPTEAGKPIQLWQRIVQSDLPPVVANRAQDDIIARWFAVKAAR